MGFLGGLAKRLGYQPIDVDPYALIPRATPAKAQPIAAPPAWLTATAGAEAYTIPDRSLPAAQLELYQRLTWVQIAVSKAAEVAATTPFNVMRLAGEDTQDIPNHPFELLLRRPNPLQSRAELLESTLAYYALTGNAYWWLNRVNGAPTELWVLPPHMVKPVPDGRMYLRGYVYEPEPGKEVPLEVTEVVHFRRFHPLNSFVGLSPIEALNTVATGDLAAQRWNTNYFDKNNAKLPGILAFADPIPDPDWDRMKREIDEQYGGTRRQLMRIRGAGKGGVEWIATAMSQADMQFLDGRTFTKEEIFAIYAPGLSSMLAVNATEANSISGKKTFVEFAVWPHLVRIAEKITNDLLPLYGPGLVGAFDDIRITDKELELSEIAAYSQTHTVDEVRQKYYQDAPLEDGRGVLLVTEVGKGITPTGVATDGQDTGPVEPAKKDILGYHIESGVVTRNEARADVGLPPVDDSTDSLLRDLRAKIEVIAAAKNAGLDVEDIASMVGLRVPVAPPAQPTPLNQQPANQPAQPEPDDDDQEDTPYDNMGQMQAEGRQGETGRQQEVKALRRWLRNRGDKADPLKFRRQYLTESDVLDIAANVVATAGWEGEADTEQPPFTMPTDGSNTRDHWHAAVKAMQLQLDPGDEDAAERIITELERRGEAAILRAFREQWRNLLPSNAETMELSELMSYVNTRLLEAQPAVDAIARTLYDAAGAGVNMALDELERIGIGFDYTLVNTRAQEWARQYSYELIAGINDTTKQAVQQAVERWYGNGEPLSALVDDLQPAFTKRRARLIAQTETTRAAAEGNRLGYKESGVVTGLVWKTSNDELVCPYCGALNGAIVSIDGGAFYDELPAELRGKVKRRFEVPPAHPGCRCRLSAQVVQP